jgi:phenylacetate-CoA ligase
VVLPLVGCVAGRRISARLADLRERQWWSAERLEADAVVRLRRLIEHARVHVPYYRRLLGDAGLRPEDIRSLADLSRIPVTTKATLGAAGLEQTTADNLPASRRWRMTTSGSAGVPLSFYVDLAAEDTRVATFMFALEWAGVGVWDGEVKLGNPFSDAATWYPPPSAMSRLGRRVLLGQRTRRLGTMRPTAEDFVRLIRQAAGRGTWFLRGLPSILVVVAARLRQEGTELPSYPKAIISRGEMLTAVRRATIEGTFRGSVTDHYACGEMAHVAQSCPTGAIGLHVIGDRVLTHLVREDGRPAEPGERGRVLLTDLENLVMPFINYAVGDLATAGPLCACGRGLPLLAAIDGREPEVIRLPSGDLISGYMFEVCVQRECDIRKLREYQVEQTAIDRVVVRLVTGPEFGPEDAERLRRGFEMLLGPGVFVEVVEVDEIPEEPSGKRLSVKTAVVS